MKQKDKPVTKTVNITLIFRKEDDTMDIMTNDVPKSVILEALSNLTKFMAEELVKEAMEEVPAEGVEKYLEGRLETDRQKLKEMLTPSKIIIPGQK